MAKSESRPKRWAAACAAASKALDDLEAAAEKFKEAADNLKGVQDEYSEWKDNLPENLQGSALAEKLEAVTSDDAEEVGQAVDDAVSDARSKIEEFEAMDLPRGFGKD